MAKKLHRLDSLLAEWRESGNPDTFLQEVRRYAHRRVWNKCREHAEDIAQLTTLYVWKHISSFDPAKSSISTWVRLTIDARLNDYLLELYRDRELTVEGLDMGNLNTDDDHQFADVTAIPESVRDIADSLMAGYSIKETAERMGVKPATLRKRLERVRNVSRFPAERGNTST